VTSDPDFLGAFTGARPPLPWRRIRSIARTVLLLAGFAVLVAGSTAFCLLYNLEAFR
jgi:hypothetical protein